MSSAPILSFAKAKYGFTGMELGDLIFGRGEVIALEADPKPPQNESHTHHRRCSWFVTRKLRNGGGEGKRQLEHPEQAGSQKTTSLKSAKRVPPSNHPPT